MNDVIEIYSALSYLYIRHTLQRKNILWKMKSREGGHDRYEWQAKYVKKG